VFLEPRRLVCRYSTPKFAAHYSKFSHILQNRCFGTFFGTGTMAVTVGWLAGPACKYHNKWCIYNSPKCGVIFMVQVYAQSTHHVAGRITKLGGPGVGYACSWTYQTGTTKVQIEWLEVLVLYLEGFEIGSDTRHCTCIPVLDYVQGTTDYYLLQYPS